MVVETAYRQALASFVDSMAQSCPEEPALAAFFRLNATYYLRVYLPPGAYARAVLDAAHDLTRAGNVDAATAPTTRLSLRRLRHGLLKLVEQRASDVAVLLLAQHALEALPELDRRRRGALLSTAAGRIAAMPVDPVLAEYVHAAHQEWLDRWAVRNARPPRQGEVLGWARSLIRREALATLRQALASGLRFDALLDALTLAAALRARRQPGLPALLELCAAHAVRRLYEISETPRLGAWLGLAVQLSSGTEAATTTPEGTATPEPPALALRAIEIGSPLAVQAAEAVLVEAETLAPEERDLLLAALAACYDAIAPEGEDRELQ
jgi:hypothetical protein